MRQLLQLLQYPDYPNCFTETTEVLPLNRCSALLRLQIHSLQNEAGVCHLRCQAMPSMTQPNCAFDLQLQQIDSVSGISSKIGVGFRRAAKRAEIFAYLVHSAHKRNFVVQYRKSSVNQVDSYNRKVYYTNINIAINTKLLRLLLKNKERNRRGDAVQHRLECQSWVVCIVAQNNLSA